MAVTRRKRVLRPPPKPPSPQELALSRLERIDGSLAKLVDLLEGGGLGNRALNARPPSHQAPPIVSKPIDTTGFFAVNDGTANGRLVVTFTCPCLHAGVITGFAFSAPTDATDVRAWMETAGNTLIFNLNRVPILGADQNHTYNLVNSDPLKAYITRHTYAVGGTIGTAPYLYGLTDTVGIRLPIFENDEVEIGLFETSGAVGVPTAFRVGMRITGYYYPARKSGDRSIRATFVEG